MSDATDETIFDRAAAEGRCIISADSDFGALLALREANRPSVVLLRGEGMRRPHHQLMVLLTNLPSIAASLEAGAVAVFERSRVRVRTLPFGRR
jgi:predicted nuclease of predicted toxin-antitoxin system